MSGFLVFLGTLLCFTVPALAQTERLNIERVTAKLWRVIDITRVYTPQTQAHVVLETPDKERLSLTFHTESATLIQHDVIAFEPKLSAPGNIPIEKWETYLIFRHVKGGKTRWWKERLQYERKEFKQEIERKLRLYLERRSNEEKEI